MSEIIIYLKFVRNELKTPLNYLLAILIGFFINILQRIPLTHSSIPYLIPLLVQIFSKASVKFMHREKDLLLNLPEQRVDPACIISSDGSITAMAGKTKELFEREHVKKIGDFLGGIKLAVDSDVLAGKTFYSDITRKWYTADVKEMNGSYLVWLHDTTAHHEYEQNIRDIQHFSKGIIDSLDTLVVHNDINDRLARLLLDHGFTSVLITQLTDKDILHGKIYKNEQESERITMKSCEVAIERGSFAPVWKSRIKNEAVCEKVSFYPTPADFEEANPFNESVKSFIGCPIENYLVYHSGIFSIIAFNKETDLTGYDELAMKTYVNTAWVTYSLVDLAVRNDAKFMQSVEGLCASSEFSDEMTGQHIYRVNSFARLTAQLYGMDDVFCRSIGQVASIHDIGKIAIPYLIKLERKLTGKERFELEMHPVYGAQILQRMMNSTYVEPRLEMGFQIALNHHQTWSGTGYPGLITKGGKLTSLESRESAYYHALRPLAGSEIPIEALFTSLADRYDALRSKRHYKPAFSHKKTCAIIAKDDFSAMRGQETFGKKIFEVFMDNHLKYNDIYQQMSD